MLKKFMSLAIAAMLVAATGYAQQYEELDYVEGQPPPEAKIGEAWCIYVYPAVYETVYEDVMVRPATMTMTPVPAVYGRRTETFVCEPEYEVGIPTPVQLGEGVKEVECVPAHTVLEVVPAQFQQKQVEVEVCPAYEEEYWVPATFRTEPREFVICPPRKELRKVACVDGTSIDCYTVVGAEAKVQTVNIKVVDQPGRVERRQVPAKRQMVTVNELVAPARVVERQIPAQMQTIRVGTVLGGGVVQRQMVPAKMGTATIMTIEKEPTIQQAKVDPVYEKQARKVLRTPERIVWRKQLLAQPVQAAYVAPAPAPVADAAAEMVEDYGSIPGSGATRQRQPQRW